MSGYLHERALLDLDAAERWVRFLTDPGVAQLRDLLPGRAGAVPRLRRRTTRARFRTLLTEQVRVS